MLAQKCLKARGRFRSLPSYGKCPRVVYVMKTHRNVFNFALFRDHVGGLGDDATPASADGAALDGRVAVGPRQGVAGRLAAFESQRFEGVHAGKSRI